MTAKAPGMAVLQNEAASLRIDAVGVPTLTKWSQFTVISSGQQRGLIKDDGTTK